MPGEPRFPGAPPQAWQVPARNPSFTGRSTDLDVIARELADGSTLTLRSVRGMSGVGATQLATEYAHARAADYQVVWWIAAGEPASIPGHFTALAAWLGLDPAADPGALRDQVHDRLRGVPGWLLIFDDAGAVPDIRAWLPAEQLPGTPGHVMITTRRDGFAAVGHVMNLDVIKLPDAVRLLHSRIPALGQGAARQIAEQLGRLPLALEQAAAYLDRSQMPANEYLELLRSRTAELSAPGQASARGDTIAALCDISLDRISGESPAAVQLLDICAYLAPEPIPLDMFAACSGQLPEPLSSAAADQAAFSDAVAVLTGYCLARRAPAGLQLHRLVQAAVRRRHGQDAPAIRTPPAPGTLPAAPGHAAGDAATPLIAEQQAGPAAHPLAVALRLLRATAPGQVADAAGHWPGPAPPLPHVLAAAGHLDCPAGWPGADAMADASWLLDRAGTDLRVRGQLADARELLERALAIDEAAYGPGHPAVATRLNDIAVMLRNLGQSQAARPLQERALSIYEAACEPGHPAVATSLGNLALILRDLGQSQTARPLAELALAIDEAALGPDSPAVASRLCDLALILRDLGEAEAAQPLAERALAIDEAAYGPDHPTIAADLSNLALILHDLGQSETARPLAELALAIGDAAQPAGPSPDGGQGAR